MMRIILLLPLLLLGACMSNPLAGLLTLDDLPVSDNTTTVAIAEAPDGEYSVDAVVAAVLAQVDDDEPQARGGLFSRLFGAGTAQEGATDSGPAAATAADDGVAASADVPSPVEVEAPDVASVTASPVIPDDIAAPQRAGFFSRLFGRSTTTTEPGAAETPTPVANTGGLADLLGSPDAEPMPAGPDARRVPMDLLLPFGQIATNCDVKRRQLGTKVGEDSGYALYDTIPNATALRTHYITGFDDGCARQFSAATALFGDIGTHEVVRYLPANRSIEYSVTDTAYEDLKASYCRAAHGQPCGGRLDQLARRTVFVSAYKEFSSSPDWANILLHDGRVVAMGPK